jgi:hypothetical protein
VADLEALRNAYREASSGRSSIHLSEDRWERLVCDELTPEEREAALDHILTCARCSDTYRALQTLRSQAPAFDPEAPSVAIPPATSTLRKRRMWGGMGLMALAAAVTMAFILPTFNPESGGVGSDPQVLRSAGERAHAIPRSPVDEVVHWTPGDPVTFRWALEAPAPAVVEVLDADGELLWSSPETAATEVRWPEGLNPLPGRYYWRVVVTGAGDKKASSALIAFDLTANRR